MKRRRFFETLTATLLAVLIGTVLAAPVMAQGKGGEKNKDKDDGGGTEEPVAPNLPPIEYHITYFDMPTDTDVRVRRTFNQMNNLGQCAGYCDGSVDGERHA